MPSIEENRATWDTEPIWHVDGDDWSESWGGVEAQWYGSVYPRVRRFLPAGTILEDRARARALDAVPRRPDRPAGGRRPVGRLRRGLPATVRRRAPRDVPPERRPLPRRGRGWIGRPGVQLRLLGARRVRRPRRLPRRSHGQARADRGGGPPPLEPGRARAPVRRLRPHPGQAPAPPRAGGRRGPVALAGPLGLGRRRRRVVRAGRPARGRSGDHQLGQPPADRLHHDRGAAVPPARGRHPRAVVRNPDFMAAAASIRAASETWPPRPAG